MIKKENLENGCKSNMKIEDIIYASCRGGWPESVLMNDKEAGLLIPKNYFEQIYKKDIFSIDNIKRNSQTM